MIIEEASVNKVLKKLLRRRTRITLSVEFGRGDINSALDAILKIADRHPEVDFKIAIRRKL